MGKILRPIKLSLAVLVFFILFTLQAGSILIPILSVILLFFWLLLERSAQDGIILAAFVGFFWDIFTSGPLGYYFSIFIISAIILKFLLNKYVRISFSK